MTTNFFRQMRASLIERLILEQLMQDQAEMFPGRALGANIVDACKSIALMPNAIDMVGRWHGRYQRLLRSDIRLFFEIRKELAANPGSQSAPYTSPLATEGVPESC